MKISPIFLTFLKFLHYFFLIYYPIDISDKVIVTKAFRTSVAIPPEAQSVEFSVVAEDVTYPAPTVAANDKYVFYVGFDPAGLKPEAPARSLRCR